MRMQDPCRKRNDCIMKWSVVGDLEWRGDEVGVWVLALPWCGMALAPDMLPYTCISWLCWSHQLPLCWHGMMTLRKMYLLQSLYSIRMVLVCFSSRLSREVACRMASTNVPSAKHLLGPPSCGMGSLLSRVTNHLLHADPGGDNPG